MERDQDWEADWLKTLLPASTRQKRGKVKNSLACKGMAGGQSSCSLQICSLLLLTPSLMNSNWSRIFKEEEGMCEDNDSAGKRQRVFGVRRGRSSQNSPTTLNVTDNNGDRHHLNRRNKQYLGNYHA